MGKLDGRVAIVTGASRGIGEGIARLLASEGAKVVCAARTINEELDFRLEADSMHRLGTRHGAAVRKLRPGMDYSSELRRAREQARKDLSRLSS